MKLYPTALFLGIIEARGGDDRPFFQSSRLGVCHEQQHLVREAANADPQAYRQLLERALFAADLFGYVAADKNQE